MRVAISRASVALRLFDKAVARREARKMADDLRWFRDCLAPVRDLDVMIERLRGLGEPLLPQQNFGFERVIEVIQTERSAAFAEFRDALGSRRRRKLIARLKAMASELEAQPGARFLSGPARSPHLDAQVAQLLERLYARFERRRAAMAANFAPEPMHSMRIAAKQLRYAMNFFRKHRPGAYRPIVAILEQLHECAGGLHDLAVLTGKVEACHANLFVQGQSELIKQAEPGVKWLLKRLEENHLGLMGEFYTIWARLAPDELGAMVKEAVRPRSAETSEQELSE
jgi:CHAD domain-containing protein